MGKLTAAMPRQKGEPDTSKAAKSPRGTHDAVFVGMSVPKPYVSEYRTDKCRLCKGQGTGYNGEGDCRVCEGSGRLTETHVILRYKLASGVVEEEEMNFILTGGGGVTASGEPKSASTLFLRMSELSGMPQPTAEKLDAWYSGLIEPIAIPCQVTINYNKARTFFRIVSVILADGTQTQPAPATRSFQPAGSAAAEETRAFQPALLDAALNNTIMDAAIDELHLTAEQWNGLLKQFVDGELVVGKTPAAKAKEMLFEMRAMAPT